MRRRSDSPRRFRQAFTLLELMLVLGLLVAVMALAWPAIQHAYQGIRLKKTADQVVAAFGHARVLAMSTGVTQVFRFQPGTGQYTKMAMGDDSQGVDSDASGAASAMVGSTAHGDSAVAVNSTGGDSSAAPMSSNPPDSNASNSSSSSVYGSSISNSAVGSCSYQLNDGYVFAKGQRTLDARAALAESELPNSDTSAGDTSDDAPPILFYPDGTASEAMVTVSDKTGRSISVSLRGLTGIARQGDAFTGEAPQ